MDIIRGVHTIKKYPRPVVAIGVFDGVHVGHRKILAECVATARRIRGTAMVLTFWPHPQKEESIYSLDHRLAIMERLGVQGCVLVRLSRSFAAMSAEQFIRNILCGKLGAVRVLVGSNFRFGRRLSGDVSTLKASEGACGYRLRVFPIVRIGGRAVSSTRIRDAISRGRLAEAERLLGGRVSLLGKVVHGRAIGRSLGYPTANIKPQHEVLPPDGIYAVKASVDGRCMSGICYKGSRPTFAGQKPATSIEAHLFDFSGTLYGKRMELRFVKKLRNDKKFESLAALKAAITRDIAKARKILSST
jgi:riboflavin kinase / FMN adenylyltransferase